MEEFEKIYKEYYHRVYAFLYKLCGQREAAEEMTQDTFYQLYKCLYKYDGSCKLFTFIAAVAKNVYYKYVRKKRIECIDLNSLEDAEDFISDTPEEACLKNLKSVKIRRVVEALPKNYRDVVILRIYADLTFPDIANALGISTSSAKVIFHRAKKILTKELCEYDL